MTFDRSFEAHLGSALKSVLYSQLVSYKVFCACFGGVKALVLVRLASEMA